jgi:hypothetical protein
MHYTQKNKKEKEKKNKKQFLVFILSQKVSIKHPKTPSDV